MSRRRHFDRSQGIWTYLFRRHFAAALVFALELAVALAWLAVKCEILFQCITKHLALPV